jgi:alkylresorcinol/alkylpyrone synthase
LWRIIPTHPRILSLATAYPPHVLDQRQVAQAAGGLFSTDFSDFSRLVPIFEHAGIDTRHSCVLLEWYLEPHDFSERNRIYLKNAVDLLERVAVDCLRTAELSAADIDMIVTVSSSGIATPSLDALLMARMAFRRDVNRLPIFGLGCGGGILGLSRAAALSRAHPGSRILFLVVELCGPTFRHGDRSMSNVVATALFGDGAGGAILSSEGNGPSVTGWGEHCFPDSLEVMGWDVGNDGLSVIFSRHIPTIVRDEMGPVALEFLERHGLVLEDVSRFVCHPGGAKVIDALEEIFEVAEGGLVDSRAVLRDYGNMSAATVMFVLEHALSDGARGHLLLSSLGPGFTAAFALVDVP